MVDSPGFDRVLSKVCHGKTNDILRVTVQETRTVSTGRLLPISTHLPTLTGLLCMWKNKCFHDTLTSLYLEWISIVFYWFLTSFSMHIGAEYLEVPPMHFLRRKVEDTRKYNWDLPLVLQLLIYYSVLYINWSRDNYLFHQVDIVTASPGKVVCEFKVEEEHTNRGGTLHGGLTATLVDVISTTAIMYTERGAPGVSVDMNITWVL